MYVGQSVRRKEGLKFITGTGRYVNDIEIKGNLYVAVLRSSVAHAKLKKKKSIIPMH